MQLHKPLKPFPTLAGECLEGDATPVDASSEDYTQALAAGDVDAVRLLIARTPDVNAVRFFAGLTLLHVACRCYHLAANGPQERRARAEAIVQLLLDAGADPMAVDRTGQMPAAWGSTPALRARMRALAEAQRFPSVTSDFGVVGSSVTQEDVGAGRFDPGLSYSCAFIPVSQAAWAPRGR